MRYFIFSIFFLSISAHADFFEGNYSLINQAENREVAASSFNPRNQVLNLPKYKNNLEARFDTKFSLSIFSLNLKPRAFVAYSHYAANEEWERAVFFQEAFLRLNLHADFYLSAGRMQFGWGPAESVSPSNWMGPEIQVLPSAFSEQKGIYRGQFNYSLGQGFSLIGMHELRDLKDHMARPRLERDSFKNRWLLKAEANWDNANKVLGMSGGQEREGGKDRIRAGYYGMYTVNDAWQFYADGVARQQLNDTWKNLASAGMRYTFENGVETRAEYIFNESGFNAAQWQQQNRLVS